MSTTALKTKTIHYFTCPFCDDKEEHTVDHLIDRQPNNRMATFGPWHCASCRNGINGSVGRINGEIVLTLDPVPVVGEIKYTGGYVLLQSPALAEGGFIHLLVRDTHIFTVGDKTETARRMKYFYDEHTCPTNWVRNIERFIEKGDTDPHGVFQYIDHVTDEELKSVLGADYKTTDSARLDQDQEQMVLERFFPQVLGIPEIKH